jgi:Tfp pilus assembly protein FimT
MTLLELMIVVMVIAILSTVAMPTFSVNEEMRLHLVEIQISNAIDYAAYLAESTGVSHAVVFAPAKDAFAVIDGAGNPVRDVLNQRDYVITFDRPDQPQGVDITAASFGANGEAAIFGPDGLPDLGGSVTIQCKSVIKVLTLNTATGRMPPP